MDEHLEAFIKPGPWVAEQVKAAKTLVFFIDAKKTMEDLSARLPKNVSPVCLKTIKTLLSHNQSHDVRLPNFQNGSEARDWFRKAIESSCEKIAQLRLEPLMQLESRVILTCLAMEERGLPFKEQLWKQRLEQYAQSIEMLGLRLKEIFTVDAGFALF